MSSSRKNPVVRKLEFSGYLNNFPATVIVHVCEEGPDKWTWNAFLFWQSQSVVERQQTSQPLWIYKYHQMMDAGVLDPTAPYRFDTGLNAALFARHWIEAQGFQYTRDIQ